ncbi:MAG: hypothetical protein QOH61_7 [Chloroflexota bacterium]|jgi:hypothetical protein|nr:hypothetical protein [Chloroflexota bacterium]
MDHIPPRPDADERIAAFLAWAARDVGAAPSREEMRRRIAARIRGRDRGAALPARRLAAAAHRLGLAAAIVLVGAALVAGAAWIGGRAPIALPTGSPVATAGATATSVPTPSNGPTPSATAVVTKCDESDVAAAGWATDSLDTAAAGPAGRQRPVNAPIYAVLPESGSDWTLAKLPLDGSPPATVLRVAAGTGLASVPGNFAWSPDGRELAFTVTTATWTPSLDSPVPVTFVCEDVFVLRSDGVPVRAVHLEAGRGATHPVWSMDGTRLAYVTYEAPERPDTAGTVWPPEESREIEILDLRDGTTTAVATCRACRVAGWSEDGATLVALHDSQSGLGLEVYDVATGTPTTVLDEAYFDSLLWGPGPREFDAIGANDAGFGLYHVSLDPLPHAGPMVVLLPRGIFPSFGTNRTALSPDHTMLAFSRISPDGVAGGQLWVAPVGDPTAAQPVSGWEPGAVLPQWAPDGSQILSVAPRDSEASVLDLVGPDGTGLRRVTARGPLNPLSQSPAWQPLWP